MKAYSMVLLCVSFAAFSQDSPSPLTGLQHDVVFDEYSSLSSSAELARRALSPLVNLEIARANAKSALRPQPIDLLHEKFALYVPLNRPSRGYGLLVFIPPWPEARVPAGWAAVLDESGLIFVSAAKSGNEENVIDRRMPLAILAAHNLMQRYPIDADRVYVGGFSGGGRAALRVALAYPDLFRGALLNAGSDPIGSGEAPLPPDDLFDQFQNSSRLVYLSGSKDDWNIQHDMVSRDSMRGWCVFGIGVVTMLGIGHELAAPDDLRRALAMLDRRPPPDAGKLSACKAGITKNLRSELHRVSEFVDHGEFGEARRSLSKVDLRYGGLAAAASIPLEERIGAMR